MTHEEESPAGDESTASDLARSIIDGDARTGGHGGGQEPGNEYPNPMGGFFNILWTPGCGARLLALAGLFVLARLRMRRRRL